MAGRDVLIGAQASHARPGPPLRAAPRPAGSAPPRPATPGRIRPSAPFDLVGNRVLRDSLQVVRTRGRVCQLGFLGGLEPVTDFNPLADLPTGVQLSFYGSAFVLGTESFPLAEIPLAEMIAKAEAGRYQAKPVRVFGFGETVEAHRAMEEGLAAGKMVVTVG